jgi:ribonuclease VapC
VIVDSSALIAILQGEPEAERLSRALARSHACLMSAANWLETSMIIFQRYGYGGIEDLDALTGKYGLTRRAVSPIQAEIAREAFIRFGKGFHPAKLNFGDCFAYALAKEINQPLLFKGDDFSQTDITAVAY